MNRVKSIYSKNTKQLCINTIQNRITPYINSNSNNSNSHNKSITILNSATTNYNNQLQQQNELIQIRNFGFLTNIYSNFKNLFTQDPEYEKMVEDFDKTFLNSRMAKKKEREEMEKKKMEEKMEAYSKSAEQRAKEEANLSEEEIAEKRKEEQRLYEELIQEKEKKQGFKPSSFKMAPKGDDIVKDTEHQIQLKKDFEIAKGVRPMPFDLDRIEPDFEECQDFISAGLSRLYVPKPDDEDGINSFFYENRPMTLIEQFDNTMETYEEPMEKLKLMEEEARSMGIKFDEIDWDNFFFTEAEFEDLPKEFLDFFHRKADSEVARNPELLREILEEEEKLAERERDALRVSVTDDQGRELDAPDHPHLYPVTTNYLNETTNTVYDEFGQEQRVKKPLELPPWWMELDYHIPRLLVNLFNKKPVRGQNGKLEFSQIPHLYRWKNKIIKSGTDYNSTIVDNWDNLFPGFSSKQVIRDSFDHFLPAYFHHFFQGNLRELEQYTTDRGHKQTVKKIAQYEGEHKVLCGDFIRLANLQKLKYVPEPKGGFSIKLSVQVFHTIGYRNYSGDIIDMNEETEAALYRTAFKIYLSFAPHKNRFGWAVRRIIPGQSYDFSIQDLNSDKKDGAKQKEKDEDDD